MELTKEEMELIQKRREETMSSADLVKNVINALNTKVATDAVNKWVKITNDYDNAFAEFEDEVNAVLKEFPQVKLDRCEMIVMESTYVNFSEDPKKLTKAMGLINETKRRNKDIYTYEHLYSWLYSLYGGVSRKDPTKTHVRMRNSYHTLKFVRSNGYMWELKFDRLSETKKWTAQSWNSPYDKTTYMNGIRKWVQKCIEEDKANVVRNNKEEERKAREKEVFRFAVDLATATNNEVGKFDYSTVRISNDSFVVTVKVCDSTIGTYIQSANISSKVPNTILTDLTTATAFIDDLKALMNKYKKEV